MRSLILRKRVLMYLCQKMISLKGILIGLRTYIVAEFGIEMRCERKHLLPGL